MRRRAGRHQPEPTICIWRRHTHHVLLDRRWRLSSLRGGIQIRNRAAQEGGEGRALAPKLVVKPGRFEIKVESDHAFTARGQKTCRAGQKQRTAYTALIGVERYGFHVA